MYRFLADSPTGSRIRGFYPKIYSPLLWLADEVPFVGDAYYDWYLRLWVSPLKMPVRI